MVNVLAEAFLNFWADGCGGGVGGGGVPNAKFIKRALRREKLRSCFVSFKLFSVF